MTAAVAEPVAVEVADGTYVLGVRHHGPGSARGGAWPSWTGSQPDAVLIEGPADADPLVRCVAADGMEPPVALLAYDADEPGARGVLAVSRSSRRSGRRCAGRSSTACSRPVLRPARRRGPRHRPTRRRTSRRSRTTRIPSEDADVETVVRSDPIGAAGRGRRVRRPRALVGRRRRVPARTAAAPFEAITEAMAALRAEPTPGTPDRDEHHEARREAYMRHRAARGAARTARERIAVVCGAWHAPALTGPLPTAAADARVLQGHAEGARSAMTWVPWTHSRLVVCVRLRRGGRPRRAGTTTCSPLPTTSCRGG